MNRNDNVAKPLTAKQVEAERNEIGRKKRAQAALSTASAGTALLGTAGVLGSAALRKKPKYSKLAARFKDVGTQTAVVGTGVGGVSSLNFADVSRRESKLDQQPNKVVVKSRSFSVPEGDEARRRAEGFGSRFGFDRSWRAHVSGSAEHAYDVPLAGQRVDANARRVGGYALLAGGVGGGGAMAARGRVVPGALVAAGGIGTNAALQRSAKGRDVQSTSIRARGYRRMMDGEAPVAKRLMAKPSPGGIVRSTVTKPTTAATKPVSRPAFYARPRTPGTGRVA